MVDEKSADTSKMDTEPSVRRPIRQEVYGRSFMRDILSETIIGYIFWSVLHGFAPMVWFYPLNLLEISGYEALAVVWFSPLLCAIPSVFSALQTRLGLFLLRAVVVASVASFQAPTTLQRLVVLTVGNFALPLLWSATWWHKTTQQRVISFWGSMLGFLALLASRIWFVSINPTWSDTRSNNIIISLGVVAILERYFAAEFPSPSPKPNETTAPHWKSVGLGFGSLLFLTHWIFGEVSVVSRWAVIGQPFSGPHPFPAGAAVFLEIITGLLLSTKLDMVTNFLWIWFIGGHTALGLYYFSGFFSFACGLLLSLFVMSTWPEMSDRLTSCPPFKTLTMAMGTYLVEMLFLVWTVAFNFVPGGYLTREQSVILLVFCVFTVGNVLRKGSPRNPEEKDSTHLGFTNLDGTGCYQAFADVKILVILIAIVGIVGFAVRLPVHTRMGLKKFEQKQFTGAIWTAHFMYDNDGWPSYERAAQLLEDTGADVIALLEADASKPFLGHNDISMWLGERLNMYDDFGPATKKHTWGSLILSRFPFVKSEHHLLPSPHGELAPAVSATVNISGTLVDFVVTHMGNDDDDLDRKEQTTYIANITRKSKNPVVFMGYVTSKPESRDYKKLTTFGKLKDIDSTDQDRFCEYIMYRGLRRLGFARITHGGLSDTEVQVAKFEIPDSKKFEDNDMVVTSKSAVDRSVQFSDKFGEFKKGHGSSDYHHYHMSTPKYFVSKSRQ
ncbi:PGAP2-interacting protein-like [Diadema setosum]|uniref:PGAP2-interacting protein-like n=1 Tax=Diadema setosum TaxID=31175 RepID=UPI003B3AA142